MDPFYGWGSSLGFMDGVRLSQGYRATTRKQFTFYLLVATPKFDPVTIRQNSATKKHLFLYHQGDRLGLGKRKKDKHQ